MRIPLRGFKAILLKEFTVIFRDPTTLFFMFFPPLLQIIAFGYALDNDVKHMAMVVLNEDRTVESRKLIDSFVNTQTFRVVGEVQNADEMAAFIRQGKAYVGLQIPPDFARDLPRHFNGLQWNTLLLGRPARIHVKHVRHTLEFLRPLVTKYFSHFFGCRRSVK
jgi:hypothetical protein